MFAQLTLVLLLLVHWAQAEWNLIWSDEFNGTQLQTNEWLFDLGIGQDGWGKWIHEKNGTVFWLKLIF